MSFEPTNSQLSQVLTNLRENSELSIDDPNVQEDLDIIKRQIITLYGKPEYKNLHTLIRTIFGSTGDIKNIEAISVKIYFGGCMFSEDNNLGSCAPICIDNVPTPDMATCEETVILAVPKGQKYIFISKNLSGSDARIYVPNAIGLTDSEKENLQKLGIRRVMFYNYQMKPINDHYIPIEYVPNRTQKLYGVENNFNAMMILVIAIIIILALMLYSVYQKNKNLST